LFVSIDFIGVSGCLCFVSLNMTKKNNLPSMVDVLIEHRKVNTLLFDRVNKILELIDVETELKKYYTKGLSIDGRESYSAVILFKMLLLQFWYGISDELVEENVKDRISFTRFCGIAMDETVPDSTVLSRFRSCLAKQNAFDKILGLINQKMEQEALQVVKGIIVDASITNTLRKPRGKKEYIIAEDRNEEEVNSTVEPATQSHVDTEAAWIKKAGKLHFGYKQHTVTNQEGFVLSVHTTPANESDTKNLKPALDKLKIAPKTPVYTDKGYNSEENDNMLNDKKLKNRIMYKAYKNKSLTEIEKKINQKISQTRYKIERTFGSMQRWFKAGIARYVGLIKTHAQHVIQAICYNLYRQPVVG
jgi:transposase, IS5 family